MGFPLFLYPNVIGCRGFRRCEVDVFSSEGPIFCESFPGLFDPHLNLNLPFILNIGLLGERVDTGAVGHIEDEGFAKTGAGLELRCCNENCGKE